MSDPVAFRGFEDRHYSAAEIGGNLYGTGGEQHSVPGGSNDIAINGGRRRKSRKTRKSRSRSKKMVAGRKGRKGKKTRKSKK